MKRISWFRPVHLLAPLWVGGFFVFVALRALLEALVWLVGPVEVRQ